MIAMDDIERKSAGAIATALVHALEKKGTLVQGLHYFEDGEHAKNYHFKTSVNFDYRLIAMLSVQLAGVLPYLETEYDMGHVVSTAVFRRRFRDIARMNRNMIFFIFSFKKHQFSVDRAYLIRYTYFCICDARGSIAQLGEHLPYKQGVTGSSPVVPTSFFNFIRLCSSVGRAGD